MSAHLQFHLLYPTLRSRPRDPSSRRETDDRVSTWFRPISPRRAPQLKGGPPESLPGAGPPADSVAPL